MIAISSVSTISIPMTNYYFLRHKKSLSYHFFSDIPFFDSFNSMGKEKNSYIFILNSYCINLTLTVSLFIYNFNYYQSPLIYYITLLAFPPAMLSATASSLPKVIFQNLFSSHTKQVLSVKPLDLAVGCRLSYLNSFAYIFSKYYMTICFKYPSIYFTTFVIKFLYPLRVISVNCIFLSS